MEIFDNCIKILAGVLGTIGAVLVVISWRKGLSEELKRKLTFWDRCFFITGAILFWVAFYSGNQVSKRQEQELSEATNRLARAETRLRPREINSEQRVKLIECLKGCPKEKVVISAGAFDGEATMFASQIEEVLTNAGFDVFRPTFPSGEVPVALMQSGLHIVVKDLKHPPQHAPGIQRCFMNSGITMEGLYSDDPNFTDRVEIAVGQKD